MDNHGQPSEKSFEKCPACGSTERFFEGIVKELRERGLASEDWNFYLEMRQGVVIEEKRALLLPIGAELPGYFFGSDICADCGNIYVVRLGRLKAKKTIQPAQMVPPQNQRMNLGKFPPPPGSRNPGLS